MAHTRNGAREIQGALIPMIDEATNGMSEEKRVIFIAGVNLGIEAAREQMNLTLAALKHAKIPALQAPGPMVA